MRTWSLFTHKHLSMFPKNRIFSYITKKSEMRKWSKLENVKHDSILYLIYWSYSHFARCPNNKYPLYIFVFWSRTQFRIMQCIYFSHLFSLLIWSSFSAFLISHIVTFLKGTNHWLCRMSLSLGLCWQFFVIRLKHFWQEYHRSIVS